MTRSSALDKAEGQYGVTRSSALDKAEGQYGVTRSLALDKAEGQYGVIRSSALSHASPPARLFPPTIPRLSSGASTSPSVLGR